MATTTDHAIENSIDNLNWRIGQHADVVRGHDAVHPDRSDCGGIGNCRLMAAEHEVEVEIIEHLTTAVRRGLTIKVEATRG